MSQSSTAAVTLSLVPLHLKPHLTFLSTSYIPNQSSVPRSSRHSVLQQFNKGLFDFLIATDTRPDDTGVSQTGGDPGGSGALERVPKRGKDKDKARDGGLVRGTVQPSHTPMVLNHKNP